jgi:hypothetical protein
MAVFYYNKIKRIRQKMCSLKKMGKPELFGIYRPSLGYNFILFFFFLPFKKCFLGVFINGIQRKRILLIKILLILLRRKGSIDGTQHTLIQYTAAFI